MIVRLAYGTEGLEVRFPDAPAVTVVEPVHLPGASDPAGTIAASLADPIGSPPLRAVAQRGGTVGVVFSGITRPAPNRLMIPAILAELAAAGAPRERITLFNATGTHRANTPEELARLLGDDVASTYRIVRYSARAAGAQALIEST